MGYNYTHTCFPKDTPSTSTLRQLDGLLHPRVPSLARAPHVESLFLSRTEECVEEQKIRESLHLSVVLPSGETRGAVNPPSITTTAPAASSVHQNLESLTNIDEPKTPAPAPLQQAPTSSDIGPARMPSHMLSVSPTAQISGTGRVNSNDALCLTQANEVLSPSMSGVVTATEGSHLGTMLEVTNAVQDDDDDDEMP